MSRSRLWVVACIAVVLLIIWWGRNFLTFPQQRPGPPSTGSDHQQFSNLNSVLYQGHPSAYWLEEMVKAPYYRIESWFPGRNGDPESLPMLLELLRSKNANVQRRIVFCLGCLGAVEGQEKKVIPVLEALLSDTDLGVVNAAAVALEGIGPKAQAARPALVARIRDQDGTINFFIVKALWAITHETQVVLPALQELLIGDPEISTDPSSAANLLGEIGPPAADAISDLILFVRKHPDHWPARYNGALALGRFGALAKPALPTLQVALRDPEPLVRVRAAEAVWRITGVDNGELVEIVREVLRNSPWASGNSQESLEALGTFGSKAEAAVPDILGILDVPGDATIPDREMHGWAAKSLKKIDPTAAGKRGIK